MGRHGWLVRACSIGLVLGAADSVANALSSPYHRWGGAIAGSGGARVAEVLSLLLDAGWLWAASAIVAGWLAGSVTRGLVAGPVTLASATVAYFCTDAALRSEQLSVIEVGYWAVAAVVIGPVLGAIGDAVSRPGVPGTLAALVVPVGASLQMVLMPPGLARTPDGWIPNPEADLARALVWALAAVAAVLVVARLVVHTRRRSSRSGTVGTAR